MFYFFINNVRLKTSNPTPETSCQNLLIKSLMINPVYMGMVKTVGKLFNSNSVKTQSQSPRQA
jgi:hypothetical protein